jgi:hypothetical protein
MRKLEGQLQEVKQQASTIQVQINSLTAVDKMKISQEQRIVQYHITTIQTRVMEVT